MVCVIWLHELESALVAGFGILNEVVASAKELHFALQLTHPNIHVIVAKIPARAENAKELQDLFTSFENLITGDI